MWQEWTVFCLSSIKFFFAPPAGIALGFDFLKTFLITSSGGITGVLFFFYFGRIVNFKVNQYLLKIYSGKKRTKKIFTYTNKLIVRIKKKLGVFGLAFFSPVIISIPLGAILASRYFKKNTTVLYFIVCILIWAAVLSALSAYFRDYK